MTIYIAEDCHLEHQLVGRSEAAGSPAESLDDIAAARGGDSGSATVDDNCRVGAVGLSNVKPNTVEGARINEKRRRINTVAACDIHFDTTTGLDSELLW